MALSPWSSGATLPLWNVTIADDSGAAVNLTGATLSLIIRNTRTLTDQTGAGSWSITSATAGQAQYTWAAADSATPGDYALIIVATYSGGGVLKTDPITWQVVAV